MPTRAAGTPAAAAAGTASTMTPPDAGGGAAIAPGRGTDETPRAVRAAPPATHDPPCRDQVAGPPSRCHGGSGERGTELPASGRRGRGAAAGPRLVGLPSRAAGDLA